MRMGYHSGLLLHIHKVKKETAPRREIHQAVSMQYKLSWTAIHLKHVPRGLAPLQHP